MSDTYRHISFLTPQITASVVKYPFNMSLVPPAHYADCTPEVVSLGIPNALHTAVFARLIDVPPSNNACIVLFLKITGVAPRIDPTRVFKEFIDTT
jgi:hypothetical protein